MAAPRDQVCMCVCVCVCARARVCVCARVFGRGEWLRSKVTRALSQYASFRVLARKRVPSGLWIPHTTTRPSHFHNVSTTLGPLCALPCCLLRTVRRTFVLVHALTPYAYFNRKRYSRARKPRPPTRSRKGVFGSRGDRSANFLACQFVVVSS